MSTRTIALVCGHDEDNLTSAFRDDFGHHLFCTDCGAVYDTDRTIP